MKKIFTKNHFRILGCALSMSLFITSVTAQNQNALSFDGVDDDVEIPNASALIAGSSAISMSFWVNPQHIPAGYPDFDGYCGLRNELDADFYVLMLSASTLECRFRNSAGTTFTISSTGVTLNTWQHYVMTYDGSMLRVFLNGAAHDSIAASGSITNTASTFYMGSVYYSSQNFFFQGMLDEVSLWNAALSPAQVNCIYNHAISPTDANLKLYFPFNQGIASGTNTNDSVATDISGHLDGPLLNMALTGATSNWVTGINNYVSRIAGVCPGGTYSFYGQTLSSAGNYVGYAPIAGGCDTAIALALSVIDTSLSIAGLSIQANMNGAAYQWRNCATGTAIAGATSQNYAPMVNGNYSCDITYGATTCASGCLNFHSLGIDEYSVLSSVSVFPNPAHHSFSIKFEKQVAAYTVEIVDVIGKQLAKYNFTNSGNETINVSDFENGFYIIRITSDNTSINYRLLKN